MEKKLRSRFVIDRIEIYTILYVIFFCRAISWACSMGNKECKKRAGEMFGDWMESQTPDTLGSNQ